MSEEKYCHSCGAKLNIDSKFCHKCGTESINSDEEIRNTKQAEENSNSSLQEQYIDIIHEKILFAYVNSVGLDLVYLYRNAPIYQFTNEMVDKYVKEFQSKVDSLEKYLSKQYINGNLIMLDTDEAIIKQISTYAFSIGFESDEDIELIRNKFFRVHRIEEKCELLHSIIEKYAIEGVIHYDLIDEYAKEAELIKKYNRNNTSNAGDVSVAFIKSLGLLLLSITLTIIFFFFMLDFKWYVILISALVVLGSWGSFGDNVSDFLDEVDHSHETNSFVREFNKTFKIVDDHIQLK